MPRTTAVPCSRSVGGATAEEDFGVERRDKLRNLVGSFFGHHEVLFLGIMSYELAMGS